MVEDLSVLPTAPVRVPAESPASGHVVAIDAQAIGLAAMGLGAGRVKKGDVIDPAVGIVLEKKVGAPVASGEPLATVHAPDRSKAAEAVRRVQAAFRIAAQAPAPRPLIHEVVG